MKLQPSEALYDHIKTAESGSPDNYNYKSYKDPVGIWTIGFGHNLEADPAYSGQDLSNITWTKDQIDNQLKTDVNNTVQGIQNLVKVSLTQGQYDALVDFEFGTGEAQLEDSTLLKLINSKAPAADIQNQFRRWVYARDKSGNLVELPGLVTRREWQSNNWVS